MYSTACGTTPPAGPPRLLRSRCLLLALRARRTDRPQSPHFARVTNADSRICIRHNAQERPFHRLTRVSLSVSVSLCLAIVGGQSVYLHVFLYLALSLCGTSSMSISLPLDLFFCSFSFVCMSSCQSVSVSATFILPLYLYPRDMQSLFLNLLFVCLSLFSLVSEPHSLLDYQLPNLFSLSFCQPTVCPHQYSSYKTKLILCCIIRVFHSTPLGLIRTPNNDA